ncbi:carbonic anhydrase [Streptomyces sp. NPDC051940]|uniref:carbonic anhydrase n=1 Tax=Streptomyces sp. NPDC051940 TaxID=3155675 RepID=UPI00341BEF67
MATRRHILGTALTLTGLSALPAIPRAATGSTGPVAPDPAPPNPRPDPRPAHAVAPRRPPLADSARLRAAAALDALLEGNRRFVAGSPRHPHESAGRRAAVAGHQHPSVCLLGCVDSRVPPELVFDQGLGDLFTVRTAGAVPDDAVLASIEYGVAELGIPLVVVLGHERCGAVRAAVDSLRTGRRPRGHLGELTARITGPARAVRDRPGDWVDNTVTANTLYVRRLVRSDPGIAPLAAAGRVTVVAARFDLDTGQVRLLSPPPGSTAPG